MHMPFATGFFGDARAPAVEVFQYVLDRLAYRAFGRRAKRFARVPGFADNLFAFAAVHGSDSDRMKEGRKITRFVIDMKGCILDAPIGLALTVVEPDRRHSARASGNEIALAVVE